VGKVSGRSKICKLAHAFLLEYSYKGLKLAQLLGQHGVFLTCRGARSGCLAGSTVQTTS
jgi:hypothetical protein